MSLPLNEPFVPLSNGATAKGKREDFRVLIATRPEAARPLRDSATPSSADSATRAPRQPCEPRVTLQKEADRVTGIHIECSCGQIIDLNCTYQD